MKPNDDSLDRLFRAAARAPQPGPPAMSSSLRARILGQWGSRPAEDEFAPLLTMFRGAAIFAGFLVIVSVTWKDLGDRHDTASALPLARYAISMQLPP